MILRTVLRGGAFVVVGLVAFGAGVYADQALPDWIPYIANHQTGRVNTAELQDAIRVIQAEYVDGNLDTTKMSQGTISGLVASLGDPYSAYYDPDQYKKLQAAYEGRYSGIGVYVTFGSSYPLITGTVPGSPAAKAGLQSGDQVLKVGGRDASGMTAELATSLIQGPDGTQVTLDRKSTRLNSSHLVISYAVFCLKKKKQTHLVPWASRRYSAPTAADTMQSTDSLSSLNTDPSRLKPYHHFVFTPLTFSPGDDPHG